MKQWLYLIALFSLSAFVKVEHTEAEWLQILGPERFHVMRAKGFERAFVGKYAYLKEDLGVYHCAACNLPLFNRLDQYDAGGGYPCFKQAISTEHIYFEEDRSLPIQRYEVLCRRCDSHLGHVFHDGPPPLLLRYCIYSIALKFERDL